MNYLLLIDITYWTSLPNFGKLLECIECLRNAFLVF